MNPLSRLMPGLRPTSDVDEEGLSDEELKKQRVQFHRDHVRNGPSNFRTISTGQQRRQITRDRTAQHRKINKRHRRAWMAQQAEVATLRGHLVVLGVLECKNEGTRFTDQQRLISGTWVVRKYGERDDAGDILESDTMLSDAVSRALEAFLQFQGAAA